MSAVVLLLIVAFVSLLIISIATVALTTTGMARPVARFQARSALSGVGFTTSEAEAVVNHPVRRRITMGLMLVGNLGLATAVAGLLGGFLRADAGASLLRAMLLVVGPGSRLLPVEVRGGRPEAVAHHRPVPQPPHRPRPARPRPPPPPLRGVLREGDRGAARHVADQTTPCELRLNDEVELAQELFDPAQQQ